MNEEDELASRQRLFFFVQKLVISPCEILFVHVQERISLLNFSLSCLSCLNLVKITLLRSTLNLLCYKASTLDNLELFPNRLLHMPWSI